MECIDASDRLRCWELVEARELRDWVSGESQSSYSSSPNTDSEITENSERDTEAREVEYSAVVALNCEVSSSSNWSKLRLIIA